MRRYLVLLAAALFATLSAEAQRKAAPAAQPIARVARSFHDAHSGVTFQVPAEFDLNRKDGEVSTFALDARSSIKSTQLRAVANITFNPFPQSTFSGAYFYLSLTPRSSAAECALQASVKNPRPVATADVGGVSFAHGYDEHGGVCTETRDEIYTAARHGSCYRFDLVINNFCGGEVSGVRDISARQLEDVRRRLEAILATVQFDKP